MRDGMNLAQAVSSSYLDFRDLAWRNYVRRLQGLPTKISTMDSVWAGYWARDIKLSVPELFLYSKTDFYTPYKYLESDVIPRRREVAKSVTVHRWDKSPHVGHLRTHNKEYMELIEKFLQSLAFPTKKE